LADMRLWVARCFNKEDIMIKKITLHGVVSIYLSMIDVYRLQNKNKKGTEHD